MTNPWQILHKRELSLLLAMVCFVNTVVIICLPFLSYHLTLLVAFASVPCCFFLISNCLQMEQSFGSLYFNHFLFISAHLTNACETNDGDFGRGNLICLLGVLCRFLYAIRTWYQNQQSSDSSEQNNDVPVLISISVSSMGSGIALMGRSFIPKDSLLGLMVGISIMFLTALGFFRYYLLCTSGKSRSHNQLLQESDKSVKCD
ncbi:hypothetical protein COLO4_05436 [Corchorus olitorius]|uniref:Uncharacterized protein n=1 Tax=Corchorus olitorius TaxID=93759 RepID=A0A1R3KR24_9ROSI|nr:hypothetical protein COLO4_05436 [Corchorus olitorius]